jgi:hypothetical protein
MKHGVNQISFTNKNKPKMLYEGGCECNDDW